MLMRYFVYVGRLRFLMMTDTYRSGGHDDVTSYIKSVENPLNPFDEQEESLNAILCRIFRGS
jgi:hypothetical protein